LPIISRKLFEAENKATFPSFDELSQFIKHRLQVVEYASSQVRPSPGPIRSVAEKKSLSSFGTAKKKIDQHSYGKRPTALVTSRSSNVKCRCCESNHQLADCDRFRQLTIDERFKLVTSHRLCLVCFGEGHWANKCKLKCYIVRQLQNQPAPQTSCLGSHDSVSVLLGTVLLYVKDASGAAHTVRGLIDSASQVSAITSDCAMRLGLKISKWTVPISG